MCPALPHAGAGKSSWPVAEFDDAELADLLDWLQEPEPAAPAAQDAPTGHKLQPPPSPAPLKAVRLAYRLASPSPFPVPELQSIASRAATPAPTPRRSHGRCPHEPFRSVSFRSLAPKRSLFAGPQQAQAQPVPQAQSQLQLEAAASCAALPRVPALTESRAGVSAGAVALPAVPPPAAPPANSALAWAAGFSRLASALGCAALAPSGGLWEPPESSDILALLTLELSSCSRTASPRPMTSGSRSFGGSGATGSTAPSLDASPSHTSARKRKAVEEPAWLASQASLTSANQRQRFCPEGAAAFAGSSLY